MSEELKPALSAEEWAIRGVARPGHDGAIGFIACDDGVGIGYDADHLGMDWMYPKREACPAIMALANAALSDDSPYKITREDVAHILDLATEPFYSGAAYNDKAVWLRLAAKLAALLPPETP